MHPSPISALCRALALILTALSLSACATTIHTTLLANHFISSETSGGLLHGSVAGGLRTGTELIIIPDAAKANAKVSPGMDTSGDAAFDATLGVLDWLDLELIDASSLFGLKVQLLGESTKNAKAGNFSLSVFGRYNGTNENETVTESSLSQNPPSVTSTARNYTYDVGVVVGYRTSEQLIFYGGPFYTRRNFSGQLTVPPPISTSTQVVPFNGTFNQYGLDFGLEAKLWHLIGRVDVALVKAEAYAQATSRYGIFPGMEFGVEF